jgi:hypothetical protein
VLCACAVDVEVIANPSAIKAIIAIANFLLFIIIALYGEKF